MTGEALITGFCYDEEVWKQVTARHTREFVKHVVPAVLKPARTLWNEVIGFVFFCLAVYCGSGVVRAYLKLGDAPPDQASGHLFRLVLSAFATFLMLYFAVSSFLRARKISRS
jgi:hypothetical protein